MDLNLRLRDGTLADTLRGGRFVVLSVQQGNGPPVVLPDDEAAMADSASADAASDAYRPGFHYVIRPDGYIAMVAAIDDAASVHRYLRQFL